MSSPPGNQAFPIDLRAFLAVASDWHECILRPLLVSSQFNSLDRLAAGTNLMVKRPSLGSLLLSLIPFPGACFSVSLWDRIHPMVLGIPFNLFWLISWLGLTPLVMWGAYRLEMRRGHEPESPGKAGGAR